MCSMCFTCFIHVFMISSSLRPCKVEMKAALPLMTSWFTEVRATHVQLRGNALFNPPCVVSCLNHQLQTPGVGRLPFPNQPTPQAPTQITRFKLIKVWKSVFSFQSNLMIKSKLLFSNIMRSSMNLSGILRTGYYLSAQLWKHPAATRVAIMTPVMESTVSDGECLMFWYHMEGNGVGELSVYLQGVDESRRPVSWNRGYNEGKHWRHGRLTLISSVPFQVNSSWSGSSCDFVDKNQNGT